VVLFVAACAGSLANHGTVDANLGRATYADIMTEIPDLFRRLGYAIYQNRETGSTLYIETGWQERAPFQDEEELGVENARSRFVVRARKAAPGLYTLRISAENQVKGLPDASGQVPDQAMEGWATMRTTEMWETYADDVITEIRLKVAAGLRTYGGPIRSPQPSSMPTS